MRGDSLRDLYAKALAILGLGLLGLAGALVDYWPVRSDLPVVAALGLPVGLGLPTLHATATPVPAVPAANRRSVRATSEVPVALDLTIPDANTNDVIFGASDDPPPPDPVGLPPSLEVGSTAMATMPTSTLELIPPVITAFEAATEKPAPAPPTPPAQSGDNRFVGAAKTIGRVGAKPITAIASGFVSLGSAFGHLFHL